MRAKRLKLYEESIYNIEAKDILNKESIEHIMSDSFNEETFLFNYIHENGLNLDVYEDTKEIEELKNSNDFEKYIRYEVEYRIENTVETIKQELTVNDTLILYRKMKVDENWLENLEEGNRLGIYWSWEEQVAEPHHGYDLKNKDLDVLLVSEIKEEYVDWINTIRLNIQPTSEEEKEIRLFKNTPIKLIRLEINGKEKNIPNLNFKT